MVEHRPWNDVIATLLSHRSVRGYLPDALPGGGVFLLVWVVLGIRRMRARRLDRYKSSPLSRDELSKARSKLKMKSTFKNS